MAKDSIDVDITSSILKELREEIDRIERSLEELTNNGARKTGFTEEEENKLTSLRGDLIGVVYRIGFPASFFTRIGTRVSRAVKGLWRQFSQLIQTITKLITKYMTQLKLDSIAITLGIPPSITVTLVPT
jgi:hypothetical protein